MLHESAKDLVVHRQLGHTAPLKQLVTIVHIEAFVALLSPSLQHLSIDVQLVVAVKDGVVSATTRKLTDFRARQQLRVEIAKPRRVVYFQARFIHAIATVTHQHSILAGVEVRHNYGLVLLARRKALLEVDLPGSVLALNHIDADATANAHLTPVVFAEDMQRAVLQ